jgi:hypothetical protein
MWVSKSGARGDLCNITVALWSILSTRSAETDQHDTKKAPTLFSWHLQINFSQGPSIVDVPLLADFRTLFFGML